MTNTANPTAPQPSAEQRGSHRLGAFLCWAVVFADIGTSVYYVPGILWRQVQWQAGLFVLMTLIAFVLLVLKYAEVSVRFPEGGGVVTVSANGLAPWVGAVGGMFILVDYFLTSAISSLSGLLYFSTIFKSIGNYVLPITVVVVILLGLLNFWGIKESASVSAAIALAAFVSDVIILLVVFINVPMPTIGKVFEKMFTGQLGGVALLTGFAGAFLAFSGLESISQLSPVMKLPRRKTVTTALILVTLTVGITSPLLTIFSTVLLNSPDLLATTTIHLNVVPTPDTFISDLGGTYGGLALLVATAIAASALLVFACNTAIIGAYHVFMALSRMGYLPKFITATNAWRGTPHNAILLATLIPAVVLIGVRGQIDILGDMYAFGLLGAFSLTCLAMDVIRYRERHGTAHIGAVEASERSAGMSEVAPTGVPWHARLSSVAGARIYLRVFAQLRAAGAQTRRRISPWATRARGSWPTLKYFLGIVTTFLVILAWFTNLFTKPLATIFGGGFTLLGVGAALLYHQRLVQQGQAPVAPMQILQRMSKSLLIVLSSASEYNHQVIEATIEFSHNHQMVFLYLSRKPTQSPRFMQFADPFLTDAEAQRTLTFASNRAKRAGLKASFIYRLGGAGQVIDIWRIIRPDEIIVEAEIAKKVSKYVPPDYVRYQQFDDVRVAHYVRRQLPYGHQTPLSGSASGNAVDGQARDASASRRQPSPEQSSPWRQRPVEVPPLEPPVEADDAVSADVPADDEEWIWTGTDLVRKTPQDSDSTDG